MIPSRPPGRHRQLYPPQSDDLDAPFAYRHSRYGSLLALFGAVVFVVMSILIGLGAMVFAHLAGWA